MLAAIESLIPHRAPMRWIDALTSCTDSTASATACLSADHFAVGGGFVLEAALVECMAQTEAAAMGHRAQTSSASGNPNHGMLVAIRDFSIHSRPRGGDELLIEVRELHRLGPMLRIAGTVSCEGRTVASGELTLYA